MWPTSPPYPATPVSGRPSTIRPPPAPTSPWMNRTCSRRWQRPGELGERPEVRIVGHRDGHVRVERSREPLSERDVSPAEVGRHRDEPVDTPHDADDGDPDPDEGIAGRRSGADDRRQLGEVCRDLIDREVARWPVDADEVEDFTARPDHGRGRQIDRDLEGRTTARSALSRTSGDGRPASPAAPVALPRPADGTELRR